MSILVGWSMADRYINGLKHMGAVDPPLKCQKDAHCKDAIDLYQALEDLQNTMNKVKSSADREDRWDEVDGNIKRRVSAWFEEVHQTTLWHKKLCRKDNCVVGNVNNCPRTRSMEQASKDVKNLNEDLKKKVRIGGTGPKPR